MRPAWRSKRRCRSAPTARRGGVRQHRHATNGSVLKLNAARDPLNGAPPSGYRELTIARDGITAPHPLVDPDGNRIVLVPPGYDGVANTNQVIARIDQRRVEYGDRLGDRTVFKRLGYLVDAIGAAASARSN